VGVLGGHLVDHSIGVLNADAVSTAVLLDQSHHLIIVLLLGPVALVLEEDLLPRDGDSAGLDHALDGHIVSLLGGAARRVSDDVYLKSIAHCLEGGECEADLGPESSHNELLAAGLLDGSDELLVLPRVHAATLDDLILGKDIEELGPDVAREAESLDGSEDSGNVEDLRGLRQGNGVVDQGLAVDRLHSEGHLGLVINEDNRGVLRGEEVEFA